MAEVGEWRYVACRCGTARLDPLPAQTDADLLYDERYFTGGAGLGGYCDYEADEALHRRNARRHLRAVQRAGGRPPGHLVELGSAAGFLLDEAMVAGWKAAGVEVSASMRDAATARSGVDVAASFEELGADDGSLDVVIAVQVVEHLVDPGAFLDRAAAALRPGGVLRIETWDRGSPIARLAGRRWQQLNPPSVVWLFDRRSLAVALRRRGLHVVRIGATLKWVSLGTVASVAAGRDGRLGRFEAATRRAAWRRLPVPYALRDLVVATARRPGGDGG